MIFTYLHGMDTEYLNSVINIVCCFALHLGDRNAVWVSDFPLYLHVLQLLWWGSGLGCLLSAR